MIFWRKFNKFRVPTWPGKDGLYLCTVDVGVDHLCVMELYWFKAQMRFIDIHRQEVFDQYDVLVDKTDDEVGEYSEIIHTDEFCDLTDIVVAWRKLPKAYMGERSDGIRSCLKKLRTSE